jgi:MSHA pilin protein MshD
MCTDPRIEPRSRRQRGVTLVELILFIVIIAVALAGVLQVLAITTANSADPVRRKQALMIAEGLLEEIQLAKFTFCDPSASNADTAANAAACTIKEQFGPNGTDPADVRPYHSVNDYVDAANTPKAAFNNSGGALVDASGEPMKVSGYAVQLTIAPQSLGGIAAAGTGADVDVLRISVEVSYDNQKLVLDGYRTRYAPNAL